MFYIKIAFFCYRQMTKMPAWHRMTLRQKMRLRLDLVKIWARGLLRYSKFCRDFRRRCRRMKRGKLSDEN